PICAWYFPSGGTPSTPITIPADSSTRIQTVSNLIPGTFYTFTLATTQEQDEYEILSDTLRAYTRPLPPNSLEDEATINEITLSWLPPLEGNYYGYIVCYEDADLGRTESPIELERHQDPTITLEGLDPDTAYDIEIKLYSGDGDIREISEPIRATINTLVPNQGNVWPKDVTTTTIKVNWEPINSANGYYLSAVGQFTGHRVEQTVGSGTNVYTFQDLTPGECYQITLTGIGVNRGGSVQQSTIPRPVGDLTITATDTDSISISWDAVEDLVDGYLVSYSPRSTLEPPTRVPASDNPSLTIDGLEENTEYEIFVASYVLQKPPNTDDIDEISESSTATASTDDFGPAQVMVETVGTTSVTVSWGISRAVDALGYRLQVVHIETGQTVYSANNLGRGITEYTVLDLQPGNLYEIVVVVDGSDEIGSTRVRLLPGTPEDLRVIHRTQSSVSVAWVAPFGRVDKYRVIFTKDDTIVSDRLVDASTTTYREEQLEPSTFYTVSVYSIAGEENYYLAQSVVPAFVTAITDNEVLYVDESDTESALDVYWDPIVGSFLQYLLTYEPPDGEQPRTIYVDPSTDPGVSLTDLTPGQTYRLILSTIFGDGTTSNEGETTYTLRPLPPGVPEVIIDTRNPQNAIIKLTLPYRTSIFDAFSVEAIKQAVGQGAGTPTVLNRLVDLDGCPELVLSGLEPDTDYVLNVIALSGSYESDVVTTTFHTPPATPGQISIGILTPETIEFWWYRVPDDASFNSYRLEIRDGRHNSLVDTQYVYKDAYLTYTFGGLDSLVPYVISVYRDTSSVPLDVATQRTTPYPPGGDVISNAVGDTAVNFQWNEPFLLSAYEYEGFEICYHPLGNRASPYQLGRANTRSSIDGLTPETRYVISVATYYGAGSDKVTSDKKTLFIITAENTQIPDVINFRIVDATSTTFTLAWDEPVRYNFDAYRLEYGPAIGYPTSPFEIPKYETSITLTHLVPLTDYQFSLYGIRTTIPEESGEVAYLNGRTDDGQFAIYPGIITDTTIGLTWGAAFSAVTQYEIRYNPPVPGQNNLVTVPATSIRNLQLAGLYPDTAYTITIRALSGTTFVTAETITVRTRRPALVIPPTGIDVQSMSVLLWLPIPPFYDYDGYHVNVNLYQMDGGYGYRVRGPIFVERSGCPHIFITGLNPDTEYTVTVAAVRENDLGGYDILTTHDPVNIETLPISPLEISFLGVGTDYIEITWQPGVGEFSNYLIEYFPIGPTTAGTIIKSKAEERVQLFTDLAPGTEYTFKVVQQGTNTAENTVTHYTRPNAPSNLDFVKIAKDLLRARWDEVDGNHAGYQVCYSPLGAISSPINTGLVREVSLNGLSTETEYTVTVVSYVGNEPNLVFSEPFTRVQETLPGDPGDIRIEDYTTDSVTISWFAVSSVANYALRRERAFGFDANPFIIIVDGAISEYTFDGLTPGEQYKFTVIPDGFDPRSMQQRTLPLPPVNFYAVGEEEDSVTLAWSNPPTSVVDEYVISYEPNVGSPQSPIILPAGTNSATINGLSPGSQYSFSIYSVAGTAPGDIRTVSEEIEITSVTPVSMRVIAYTTNTLTVRWPQIDGDFDAYHISYSPYIPGANTLISPRRVAKSSGVTDLQIYGLVPGQLYTVTLRSQLGTQFTDDVYSVLQQRLYPLPVTDIKLRARTTSSLSLYWDDVDGIKTAYKVTFTPADGNLPEVSYIETFAYHVNLNVYQLLPGKPYSVSVRTVSGDQESLAEYHERFVTAPPPPREFVVSNIGTSTLSLSWQPPAGTSLPVGNYRLYVTPDAAGFPVSISGTSQSFDISGGLEPGRRYELSLETIIVSRDNYDESAEIRSNPAKAYVVMYPSEPLITDLETTSSTITVKWQPGPGTVTEYAVSYRRSSTGSGGSDPIIVSAYSGSGSPMTTITGLAPGQMYTISVKAVVNYNSNDGDEVPGERRESSEVSRTATTLPNSVQNLRASDVQEREITIIWDRPTGPWEFYQVKTYEYGSDDERYIDTGVTEFSLNGLIPYTTYVYEVYNVVNGATRSLAQRIEVTTLPDESSPPREFEVSPATPNSVEAKWIEPEYLNGEIIYYKIEYYGELEGEVEEHIGSIDIPYAPNSVGKQEAEIANLRPGYTYTFEIMAVNQVSGSEKTPSVPAEVTLLETAPPAPPDDRVALPGDARPTKHTITIIIPPDLFDTPFGRIHYFAVIVAEGLDYPAPQLLIEENYPDGQMPNWWDVQEERKWPPYQVTPKYWNPWKGITKRQLLQDMHYRFTIGAENCEERNQKYCNGPLKSLTPYFVIIRAYGVDGTYSDTVWSEPQLTTTNPDWFMYISIGYIIFIAIIFLILVLLGLGCCGTVDKEALLNSDSFDDDDYELGGMPSRNSPPMIPKMSLMSNRPLRRPQSHSRSSHDRIYGKPTSRFSKPVCCAKFNDHMRLMTANHKYSEEYALLSEIGIDLPKECGRNPNNAYKNRYRNILPNDSNRCRLQQFEDTDYINASYIDGFRSEREYIATQGPTQDTLNDFWEAIWEQNSHTIVMLANSVENGRIKCETYWPENENEIKEYGAITVTCNNIAEMGDYVVRHFSVEKDGDTRNVSQFQFKGWADQGIPKDTTPLTQLIQTVRAQHQRSAGPIFVHCSAGVGRTGVFVALDILLQQLSSGTEYIDIYAVVARIRTQRCFMVQTEEQYQFVHRCVQRALQSGIGGAGHGNWAVGPSSRRQNRLSDIEEVDDEF
ncbi:tyrosine-protein phosphatase 10D-like, partial [Amphiura filiformis]|uniref:tyrosine-protein phosphatase 10D-like n=1 Tax=Amphiura filiformis TaxID=82378 RepID=UPI003B21AE0D